MSKKQTDRYVVEINDWGCGTLIKDTLTGEEIDAPAEETVNLCIMEMNKLAAENERLRNAGDAFYESKIGYYGEQILNDMKHHSGELCRNWNAAKEGKPSV